jgi:hypothetical protein
MVFDKDSFPLTVSLSLTDLDFLCESGPMVSTIEIHLTTAGTSTVAPRWPAPEIPPDFEPPAAPLPTPAVPPGFLPRTAPTAAPPAVIDGPPPRTWPASPVTYIRWEVGAAAMGTCGIPGATMSWEVDVGAAGTCGAPGATLRLEVGAGAVGTRGSPRAVMRREVGAGATGTRGAPEAALSREVGIRVAATRGGPELPYAGRRVPLHRPLFCHVVPLELP